MAVSFMREILQCTGGSVFGKFKDARKSGAEG
jgi:hypothetical protein